MRTSYFVSCIHVHNVFLQYKFIRCLYFTKTPKNLLCEKYKIPRMVYVTEMDDDNASFRQVVADLQEMYGKRIAPFHLPIRENEKFVGYVNVVAQTGNRWNEKGEERIFADKRICNGLIYVETLGLRNIIIAVKDFIGLHIDALTGMRKARLWRPRFRIIPRQI